MKSSNFDEGYVCNESKRFLFFRRPLPNRLPPTAAHRLTSVTFNGKELVRYDYDGYGNLTAVYGRDGKKLRGFAYRNHIMVDYRHKCDSVYEIYKKD